MRGGSAARGQPLAAQHTLVSMPVLVQVAALVLPEFLSSHMLMLLPPATEHLPIRTCQFALANSHLPIRCSHGAAASLLALRLHRFLALAA